MCDASKGNSRKQNHVVVNPGFRAELARLVQGSLEIEDTHRPRVLR